MGAISRAFAIALLVLSAVHDAQTEPTGSTQDVVCPDQCECRDRKGTQRTYRVECREGELSSLRELNIPSITTQL